MAIANGTWAVTSEIGLNQAIDAVSSTQQHPVGKKVTARDTGATNYGEAEFIYLRGAASTVLGNYVVYEGNGTTIRAVPRAIGPGAVAMAATDVNTWGWYQVRGRAKVSAGAVTDNTSVSIAATPAGALASAFVAGDVVAGARSDGATDTGFALVTLNYPSTNDSDNT